MRRKIVFSLVLVLFAVGDLACGMVSLPPIGPMPTNPPTKLRRMTPWTNETIKLVVPGSSNPPVKCIIEDMPAQWAAYEVAPHPVAPYLHEFVILAFHDPHRKMNCIVPQGKTFYVSGKSGLTGYSAARGRGISWMHSYLELPDGQGDLNAAIKKFENTFDGAKLNNHLLASMHNGVGFQKVSPLFYDLVAPVGGTNFAEMKVEGFDVMDGIIHVDVRNMATHTLGRYWIDPGKKKIIQSIVGGHHMSLDSGSPWADPVD